MALPPPAPPQSTAAAVRMSRCGIDDARFAALAPSLSGEDSLVTSIDLSHNALTAAGAAALAAALMSSVKGRLLNLCGNGAVGDAGAVALAPAFGTSDSHFCALTSIDLSRCGVGDAGAAALGRALETNRELQVLRLSGNAVGDAGAAAVAAALGQAGCVTVSLLLLLLLLLLLVRPRSSAIATTSTPAH